MTVSTTRHLCLATFAIALFAAIPPGALASEPTGRTGDPGSQAGNAGEWKTYDYGADGLRLRLPGDWLPVPEAAIREFSEHASSQLPGMATKAQFKYAFQCGPISQWFRTPYILIDVRQGRPAWRQLTSLTPIQRPRQPTDLHQGPGIFESMPIGAIRFEREKNIVWMNLSHRLPDDRSARCASALLPTQLGVMQINMYALEEEAPKYLKLFERIALATQLDPSIAYAKYPVERLPLLNRMDWTKPGMRYAEIMVAALVIILFVSSIILVQRKNAE